MHHLQNQNNFWISQQGLDFWLINLRLVLNIIEMFSGAPKWGTIKRGAPHVQYIHPEKGTPHISSCTGRVAPHDPYIHHYPEKGRPISHLLLEEGRPKMGHHQKRAPHDPYSPHHPDKGAPYLILHWKRGAPNGAPYQKSGAYQLILLYSVFSKEVL